MAIPYLPQSLRERYKREEVITYENPSKTTDKWFRVSLSEAIEFSEGKIKLYSTKHGVNSEYSFEEKDGYQPVGEFPKGVVIDRRRTNNRKEIEAKREKNGVMDVIARWECED